MIAALLQTLLTKIALEYCKKALEEGKKIHHIDPIQYTEIGHILMSKNKLEEAFKYFDEGYRSASTIKSWTFIYCINAMSFYYHYQQKYLKSFGFSKMALKYLVSCFSHSHQLFFQIFQLHIEESGKQN